MNKSEKELVEATKRPSARRAASESDPPAADGVGRTAKRVHARRPTREREPARVVPLDAESAGIELGHAPGAEAGELAAPAAAPHDEGISFSAPRAEGQDSPAAASSFAAAERANRVRARRPRASQQSGQRHAAAPATAASAVGRQPAAAGAPSLHSDVSELVPSSAASDALDASDNWTARLRRARDYADDLDFQAPSLDHADFADDFGLDLEYESKMRPWLDSLCERHFHVEVHGAENIPAHGRVLLVANHSRASVWDGIVLRAALRAHHPAGRMPRWLVDDQQFHAPFLGTFVNRLGAVRACQENAERLLLREELVAVFPEGSKAIERPYEERYRLQRFGRGGYVKLALRTGTPVIPVAIVAREYEGAVWRNRLANASRMLTAPFSVLRPGLPRMGSLGVPPISARIRIYVGAAVAEISRQDASATRDDGLVHELNECVRSAVQNLVNNGLHA